MLEGWLIILGLLQSPIDADAARSGRSCLTSTRMLDNIAQVFRWDFLDYCNQVSFISAPLLPINAAAYQL